MRNYNTAPLKLNSRFIVFLSMAYVMVSLAADVVAYKFTNFFGFIESGATIIFPLTYVIGDVICEVYGWQTSMKIIWLGLLCEAIFGGLIALIIHLPDYQSTISHTLYIKVLGDLWFFIFAGIVANVISGLLNIFLISKSKILTKGRVFWIRSILSTCISEFILILITASIAFLPTMHFHMTFKICLDAYLLEIAYAILFVFPAQLLVTFLKQKENIDAFDFDVSYNPFNFI